MCSTQEATFALAIPIAAYPILEGIVVRASYHSSVLSCCMFHFHMPVHVLYCFVCNLLPLTSFLQVKSPPKAFEEVVKTHFRLSQDRILETCKVWADEGGARERNLLEEMRTHFKKL